MSEVCLHAFTLRQMVKKSVNEGMRKSVDISADFDVPFTLVNRGLRKNGKKKMPFTPANLHVCWLSCQL